MMGRADVAPSLDAVEAYTEQYEPYEVYNGNNNSNSRGTVGDRVSFDKLITFRTIPAEGKGRPVAEAGGSKTKAAALSSAPLRPF